MSAWRIAAALCLLAAQAQAGAWARGEGNTFVALSYAMSVDPDAIGTSAFDPDGYLSLLIERGLTQRLTFGVDAGLAEGGDYKAVAYFSRTFGPPDATNRFAVHAGAGWSRHDGAEDPLGYLGASWGRGFDTRWGPGWAALDATLYYRVNSAELVRKADLTVGLKPNQRTKLFVQLQAGKYPGSDTYLRAVPSVAYELAPGRHVELGVSVGVVGDRDVGIKLGTWLEF